MSSSSSDISFIRWLEQNSMGDYIESLSNLGITCIDHLLSLSHAQLIEVGRQLNIKNIRICNFAESVINHEKYKNKHTINENILSDDIKLSYKLIRLLKKLSIMGPRDNWDNVTEEIYSLIDETKNIRELIVSIDESIKIDKNNYIAWDLNGLINARRGFLADARVAFQRSLVKNPNYLNARFNHARLLHYELSEYQRAKSEYECILRVKPNFSRAYNSYAKLMEKLGDLETAEKYFRRAIQLRPKSISYRHCLANILASQSRHLEVQQIYQESVSQHPKSATLRFHHALALVKCKYYRESEMEFKNAIKLNSKNAQIYHEYAKFCERHRQPPDYKKATDLYFKACSTDPINFLSAAVDAANLMRRLDTKQSRESAKQLFEKLVVEAPHLNGAFLGYAKLLVREKEYKKVHEILNNGLSHHPKDEQLKKYYAEYKTISNSRPSVLYTATTPINNNQQQNNHHNHAQTQILNGNGSKGKGSNNDTSASHAKSSQSNGALDTMQQQQKLNKNIEFSTNQFVKGISFDHDQSATNSNNNRTVKYSITNSQSTTNAIQNNRSTTNVTSKSYSNTSAISLSMSEDINTPPLPYKQGATHQNHNHSTSTSLSVNTVKIKKDSVRYGRISNLLNQNSDLNASLYPALNETESPSPPLNAQNADKLKKRDSSSPRRYSKRASMTENINHALPTQPTVNPLNKHRQSIKKKVTINEADIFGGPSSNNHHHGHHNHHNNNHHHNNHHNHTKELNQKRNSLIHGAPIKPNTAPRTSKQFNPEAIVAKRQSQTFQQPVPPLIAASQHNSPVIKPQSNGPTNVQRKRSSSSSPQTTTTKSNTNNNNTKDTDTNNMNANHLKNTSNGKEDGNCLIM